MKPVRFILILLAVGLLVSAFAPVQLSNNVAQKSATSTAHAQSGLDLSLQSPLTIMAGAPALTFVIQAAPSSASAYACSLVSQTPADWTVMGRRQYFDAKWTVKNTGTKTWTTNGIKFRYISGTKMNTNGDYYRLHANVSSGKKVTLVVDMNAPKPYGWYTAVWGLYNGASNFCVVSISIGVWHP